MSHTESDTPPAELDAAAALASARRVVVKIGSSLLTTDADGRRPLDLTVLAADAIKALGPNGDLCFVSSGAVALGRQHQIEAGMTVADKQALAAIGQIDLMVQWRAALAAVGRKAAQILLTPEITERRRRYLNARASLRTLLDWGIIPIINENDVVATTGLRYGDNDRLAAMAAGLVDADTVVLLTDVDGLYTDNPAKNPDAKHVSLVKPEYLTRIDKSGMDPGSSVGTGGMASKIDAARLATSWGLRVIITSGRTPEPFSAIANGSARATVFEAARPMVPARRRWLAGLTPTGGIAHVDEGALKALREGKSLLAVGVSRIDKPFEEGDVVSVVAPNGKPVGFGLAKASSTAIENRSVKIAFHRDDFVLEMDSQ
ncbi:glutamate 5-kinase [Parvularcula sp. LCG005]|uniref:glutamate 5-kinase n=1 Tax=Parvularcula sp. LCG005 TaxID=3078805 RepID=UPI002943D4E3|nr:glutamate 5-kinase [Parvularcula sp. LCG005]WOI53121.1 glutamate 5-kinase [Parvularcula sp. LCG005]